MLVFYCKQCLPEKVIVGYGRRCDADVPHGIHEPALRNGFFPIKSSDWNNTIYVEGDDTQTKANIVANFGDEFVE